MTDAAAPAKFDNGPEPLKEDVKFRAQVFWFIALFLASVSFVLQLISMSTKDMINGSKIVQQTQGQVVVDGRIWRSYGAWTSCQTPSGAITGYTAGCWSTTSTCTDMNQRIILVQACEVLCIIFSAVGWIPVLLATTGSRTGCRKTLRYAYIFTFLQFALTLIIWSVVVSFIYNSNPPVCSGAKIIDVDGEPNVGNSLIEIAVAWICATLQFIMILIAHYIVARPATEESADEEAKARNTEPTAAAAN